LIGCLGAVLLAISSNFYRTAVIFYTDADMQFDLRELGHFLRYLEKYDLIIGYRISRQDPWYRIAFGFAWNKLIRLLFGLRVRDIDCAFKLFRRSVMEKLEIACKGAMFSAEFLMKARAKGVNFKEIGVTHFPRRAGQQTGGSLWVIARAFKELFWFYRNWHFQGKPRGNLS